MFLLKEIIILFVIGFSSIHSQHFKCFSHHILMSTRYNNISNGTLSSRFFPTKYPLISNLEERLLSIRNHPQHFCKLHSNPVRISSNTRYNYRKHPTKEIMAEMQITENTLKFHNKNIYGKLGVSSSKELVKSYR